MVCKYKLIYISYEFDAHLNCDNWIRKRISGVRFHIFEVGFDRQCQWKDHFWFICIFLGFTMKICFGYYKHSLINQAEVDKNINHKQSQNNHEHVKTITF